jgi:hypothetical protein
MPTAPRPRTAAARGDVICAPGRRANARAQAATSQAPQPLSCAIAAATDGALGATTAVRSARPSTSTTIGTAATFAGTVTSEIWWNWNHVTGAVASPQAVETPMSCASPCETGYPSSARTTRGLTTKMDATAANESWKPASKSAYGFQPRSTPRRRAAPASGRAHGRPTRRGSQDRRQEPRARQTGGARRRARTPRRRAGQRPEQSRSPSRAAKLPPQRLRRRPRPSTRRLRGSGTGRWRGSPQGDLGRLRTNGRARSLRSRRVARLSPRVAMSPASQRPTRSPTPETPPRRRPRATSEREEPRGCLAAVATSPRRSRWMVPAEPAARR